MMMVVNIEVNLMNRENKGKDFFEFQMAKYISGISSMIKLTVMEY